MKIVIVDDEPLARDRLKHMVNGINEHNVIGEAGNGVKALEVIAEQKPDAVLLDIRMPGMDGLEVARHLLHTENHPAIIFTTAYGEHALEAFDVQAVGYVLKPVRQEKLLQALEKATRLNQAQLDALNQNPNSRSHINARVRGNIQLIPIEDIHFFQADHKYVNVNHKNGESLIEDTLKDLEKEFSHLFIRIHRNALVAKKEISGMVKSASGQQLITLKNSEAQLEVSRRHISEVRKMLKSL
ncbi:MAG: LytTR family DNA-binding domain-containing protein [Pseudomonadota bacterium]